MTSKTKTLAVVVASAAALATSYNVGFNHGVDTASCVMFDLLTDLPPQQNVFCGDAKAADNVIRRTYLQVIGDAVLGGSDDPE